MVKARDVWGSLSEILALTNMLEEKPDTFHWEKDFSAFGVIWFALRDGRSPDDFFWNRSLVWHRLTTQFARRYGSGFVEPVSELATQIREFLNHNVALFPENRHVQVSTRHMQIFTSAMDTEIEDLNRDDETVYSSSDYSPRSLSASSSGYD